MSFLEDKKFERKMKKLTKEVDSLYLRGLPFHREIFEIEVILAKLVMKEQGMRIEDIDWFTDVIPDFEFQVVGSGAGSLKIKKHMEPDVPTLMLHMANVYSHLKTTEQTENANWVKLTEGLMLGLLLTDLKRTTGNDIYMPINSFVIEIPEKTMYIYDKITGWHETKYIIVTRGESPHFGEGLFIYAYSQANENSVHILDDHAEYFPLDISEPNSSLKDVIEVYEELMKEEAGQIRRTTHGRVILASRDETLGRIFGEEYRGGEFRERLLRIVVNTILYINSESAVVESAHQGEIDEIKKTIRQKKRRRASPQARQKLKQLEEDPYYILGTDITITPRQIRDYEEAEEEELMAKRTGRKLTRPTLTRGHWRHQPHGKGRKLRKLIWIKPFIRGKELGGPVVAHRYRFKENPELVNVPYWWPDDDAYEWEDEYEV